MRKLAVALTVAIVAASLAILPSTALAISKHQALNSTFRYARQACNHDSYCQKYGASSCARYSNGVACWAWNYEQHNGKYTCKRRILWHSPYHGTYLTNWNCRLPGWNWGPLG